MIITTLAIDHRYGQHKYQAMNYWCSHENANNNLLYYKTHINPTCWEPTRKWKDATNHIFSSPWQIMWEEKHLSLCTHNHDLETDNGAWWGLDRVDSICTLCPNHEWGVSQPMTLLFTINHIIHKPYPTTPSWTLHLVCALYTYAHKWKIWRK